jgi:glutaredoxin
MRRLLVLLVVLLVGCSCGKEQGEGLESTGAVPTSHELPPLELRDDTPHLLLTWIDPTGDFHVVQKPADVPEASRGAVRAVVTTREDGTGALVYVADLSKKNADGTYPVKTMTRAAWDEKGAEKRKARLEALAPPPPSASVAAAPTAEKPDGKLVVIIYGADWCKPCHDAARYLKQRGISVVEKDIEQSPLAAREMKQKLTKAGLPDASIPIIDVAGQILVGFSPRALDRAIETARNAARL